MECLSTALGGSGHIRIPIMELILELEFGMQHVGTVDPQLTQIRSAQIEVLKTQIRVVDGGKWIRGVLLCKCVA